MNLNEKDLNKSRQTTEVHLVSHNPRTILPDCGGCCLRLISFALYYLNIINIVITMVKRTGGVEILTIHK